MDLVCLKNLMAKSSSMENIATSGCAAKIPAMEYITIRLKGVRNILDSICVLIGGANMKFDYEEKVTYLHCIEVDTEDEELFEEVAEEIHEEM